MRPERLQGPEYAGHGSGVTGFAQRERGATAKF